MLIKHLLFALVTLGWIWTSVHGTQPHHAAHRPRHYPIHTPRRPPIESIGPLTYQRQELASGAGITWMINNKNGTINNIPATVPGEVVLDLQAAGVMQGDPYYRDSEVHWQWVAYDDWTYTTTFDLEEGLTSYQNIQLQCDGIDTISTITLNGEIVGGTNNMHLRFLFDVTSILKPTGNVLSITIYSAINAGLQASEAYPYPVPSDDGPKFLPYRNFVRKAQSDYGWDWGPAFNPSGIWQPIALVGSSTSRFMNLVVSQYPANDMTPKHAKAMGMAEGDVLLKVTSHFRVVPNSAAGTVCASIAVASGTISNCTAQTIGQSCVLGEIATDVWFNVPAADVQLWWPNGYGAAPLFQVSANYTDANGATDQASRNIGFKTVEVVRETGPVGQNGSSFYYVVNGVPIFIKGANMIPADAFHNRVTDYNLTLSLSSLLETGGNLVRVWGGGIYQRDVLYDFADANGLLVWQEFAFACAMYPRDHDFLALVRQEVAYQIRRISSHASLLIFGGNNENEAALTWFELTRLNRDIYLVDYVKLYVDTMRHQLNRELGTTIPFVTSSPTRGPQSEDPYTQLWGVAQSPDYGDMHYYNYAADCSDVSQLPRARFISEFGFQSLPSLFTWSPVIEQSDWVWNSTMMEFRQRHPLGNEELYAQMQMHFQMPNSADPAQQFDDWIYLTQSVQSLCYRTAFQHWRRIKQETPGRTMGIIYWQLNDIWQGPTWSSLEYGGRWKQLHYAVKRAYAPVIASGYYDTPSDQIYMYLTSDLTTPLTGTYLYTVSSWISGDLQTYPIEFNLDPLGSVRLFNITATELFNQAQCPTRAECYVTVSITPQAGLNVPPAEIFVTPIRDSPLQPATLSFSNFQATIPNQPPTALTAATFTLSCDAAAPYVFLETPLYGRFDDNGFVMGRRTQRTLTFTSFNDQTFALADLQATLKARTIQQTYSSSHLQSAHHDIRAEPIMETD